MAAPMAFRNKDEALEELVTSEERYVKALKTFRNVRTCLDEEDGLLTDEISLV